MAIFEYWCDYCKQSFEKRVSIADRDTVTCISCHRPVQRLISAFHVGKSSQLPSPCKNGTCSISAGNNPSFSCQSCCPSLRD